MLHIISNMKKKVLIVDDEPDIREFLDYNLEKNGYITESAIHGLDCMEKVKIFQPELIIMDVMMPKLNGVETCEKIRENPLFKNIIILFLSARSEDFSQIACYDAGGDDFVSKPIKIKLLIRKINSLLRRNYSNTQNTVNGISIDEEQYVVYCNEVSIKLPKKQFHLLQLLHSAPGKVFKRDDIISIVWGTDYYISSRNIDVQIRKIREKIGVDKIETVKGVGYRFNNF